MFLFRVWQILLFANPTVAAWEFSGNAPVARIAGQVKWEASCQRYYEAGKEASYLANVIEYESADRTHKKKEERRRPGHNFLNQPDADLETRLSFVNLTEQVRVDQLPLFTRA